MFWEGDTVVLKKPVPGMPVPVGAEGLVFGVFGFSRPPAYDVDFFDENHESLGQFRIFGDENLSLKTSIKDQLEGLK
ncbi:MAG: hypothetical protein ABSE40_09455 [Candidatus Sulfotelmatobacter sp.]|jgi:hypothetical protein